MLCQNPKAVLCQKTTLLCRQTKKILYHKKDFVILNHILKVFDDQIVTFNFTGNNRPILITNKKDNNLKFLVLPLRN